MQAPCLRLDRANMGARYSLHARVECYGILSARYQIALGFILAGCLPQSLLVARTKHCHAQPPLSFVLTHLTNHC